MQDVSRRAFLGGAATLVAAVAAGCATPDEPIGPTHVGLTFDPTAYTEKTTTVATSSGAKSVTYRFYGPVTYVANPVDADYQSLTVSVPISIDGRPVDAANAPIVLANSVGGYMPSSVKGSTGVGEQTMTGVPAGSAAASGSAAPSGEVASGGNTMLNGAGKTVSLAKLAVAAGYVAVEPGVRGRTLVNAKGDYYGVAPAAIVDLKAAVRYLRANAGRLPGDVERLVSTGTSAGGALSALLGASGDSPLYDSYLRDLGAASASDAIFAAGCWCPIADLENADGAYEWNWGTNSIAGTGKLADQKLSAQLRDKFVTYQQSLKLTGRNGYGPLTADNYTDYLLTTYLRPSATRFLTAMSAAARSAYLAKNPFIDFAAGTAFFDWDGYVDHVGARKKSLPAFDAFDLSAGENNLFGRGTTKARHFTAYSAARSTSGSKAVDADIPDLLNLMNPMYHLRTANSQRCRKWWIRLGTKDSDTSLTVSSNIAAAAAGLGDEVNHRMYWDQGHGANDDAAAFIEWVGTVTK
ncbi:Tat pathway signal sequence domain protein [Gordonia sp. TBRC 11910]|uniref:Tat pathway signal sequence domain protein n=1 Tax=Gordonia asplenii TaxID=2725283 RepID=A0A848L2V5_9ACTN|nr:subtype B tannase [Gordonia asplenii]NMO04762.1 Tat pathway signal sequence domain protein [Gordonia asplenii]